LIERQEDMLPVVHFSQLNTFSIIGNPLVLRAMQAAFKRPDSVQQKKRPACGKPWIIKKQNGHIQLDYGEQAPSLESIKEIERLLYVSNRTLLLWKPEPTDPVRRVDEVMRPINVSKLSRHHGSFNKKGGRSTTVEGGSTNDNPHNEGGGFEDSEDDEFDHDMSRIRNPRLFKGEAFPLTDFYITNNTENGDFAGETLQ
jgi:hypothetical protein